MILYLNRKKIRKKMKKKFNQRAKVITHLPKVTVIIRKRRDILDKKEKISIFNNK